MWNKWYAHFWPLIIIPHSSSCMRVHYSYYVIGLGLIDNSFNFDVYARRCVPSMDVLGWMDRRHRAEYRKLNLSFGYATRHQYACVHILPAKLRLVDWKLRQPQIISDADSRESPFAHKRNEIFTKWKHEPKCPMFTSLGEHQSAVKRKFEIGNSFSEPFWHYYFRSFAYSNAPTENRSKFWKRSMKRKKKLPEIRNRIRIKRHVKLIEYEGLNWVENEYRDWFSFTVIIAFIYLVPWCAGNTFLAILYSSYLGISQTINGWDSPLKWKTIKINGWHGFHCSEERTVGWILVLPSHSIVHPVPVACHIYIVTTRDTNCMVSSWWISGTTTIASNVNQRRIRINRGNFLGKSRNVFFFSRRKCDWWRILSMVHRQPQHARIAKRFWVVKKWCTNHSKNCISSLHFPSY